MSMAVGKAPVQLRLTNGDRIGGPFQRDPLPLIDYLTEVQPDPAGSLDSAAGAASGATAAAPP